MLYITLDLFCILHKPITDDEIAQALASKYPDAVMASGAGLHGFIGYYGIGGHFQRLCFRNLEGDYRQQPESLKMILQSDGRPSEHFLGVVPKHNPVFREVFQDRMQYMLRQIAVLVPFEE